MHQIDVNEAQAQFSALLDAVRGGETVFITKDGEQIAQLVPVQNILRKRQFGSARGILSTAADSDAPLPDFDEYK